MKKLFYLAIIVLACVVGFNFLSNLFQQTPSYEPTTPDITIGDSTIYYDKTPLGNEIEIETKRVRKVSAYSFAGGCQIAGFDFDLFGTYNDQVLTMCDTFRFEMGFSKGNLIGQRIDKRTDGVTKKILKVTGRFPDTLSISSVTRPEQKYKVTDKLGGIAKYLACAADIEASLLQCYGDLKQRSYAVLEKDMIENGYKYAAKAAESIMNSIHGTYNLTKDDKFDIIIVELDWKNDQKFLFECIDGQCKQILNTGLDF